MRYLSNPMMLTCANESFIASIIFVKPLIQVKDPENLDRDISTQEITSFYNFICINPMINSRVKTTIMKSQPRPNNLNRIYFTCIDKLFLLNPPSD